MNDFGALVSYNTLSVCFIPLNIYNDHDNLLDAVGRIFRVDFTLQVIDNAA